MRKFVQVTLDVRRISRGQPRHHPEVQGSSFPKNFKTPYLQLYGLT